MWFGGENAKIHRFVTPCTSYKGQQVDHVMQFWVCVSWAMIMIPARICSWGFQTSLQTFDFTRRRKRVTSETTRNKRVELGVECFSHVCWATVVIFKPVFCAWEAKNNKTIDKNNSPKGLCGDLIADQTTKTLTPTAQIVLFFSTWKTIKPTKYSELVQKGHWKNYPFDPISLDLVKYLYTYQTCLLTE